MNENTGKLILRLMLGFLILMHGFNKLIRLSNYSASPRPKLSLC